jgi:hypothetical protein
MESGVFWRGTSSPCNTGSWTDTIVEYDRAANRWFVSRFAFADTDGDFSSGNDAAVQDGDADDEGWTQCVAVSQTGDPTGGYYLYAFKIGSPHYPYWQDYPKFGIWPDGYYMTGEADQIFRSTSKGIYVDALDRTAMLTGAPAHEVLWFVPVLDGPSGVREMSMMQPASWDGSTPPPAGAPELLAQVEDDNVGFASDEIALWAFHVDWSNPAASTLTVHDELPTDPFDSNVCEPADTTVGPNLLCIVQENFGVKLDPVTSGYTGFRLVYRNFGDHQALALAQTVAASDSTSHTGLRWYELRSNGGAWSIYQQGTYAPDGEDRWLPSPGIDRAGDIALGFEVAGAGLFPSIRYVGREPGDPLGTLPRAEGTIVTGAGAQDDNSEFGDYTQMTVDPSDDCTLWYTAEYYENSNVNHDFSTRIGAFRFPGCSTTTNLTYTGPTSGDYGAPVKLSAQLTSPFGPVAGQTVTIGFGAESCSDTTDVGGTASCTVTPADTPAGSPYPINASFAGTPGYLPSSDTSHSFTVLRAPTKTTYTGPTSGDYGTPVVLSAQLTANGGPLAGQTVTIRFGAESCSGMTDGGGTASCTVTPTDRPAGSPYPLTASFVGTGTYLPSSDTSRSFTVLRAPTKLVAAPAKLGLLSVTFSARLTARDTGAPLAGRTVAFSASSPLPTACQAMTNGAGVASCTVFPALVITLGPASYAASFAGGADYLPSSASGQL